MNKKTQSCSDFDLKRLGIYCLALIVAIIGGVGYEISVENTGKWASIAANNHESLGKYFVPFCGSSLIMIFPPRPHPIISKLTTLVFILGLFLGPWQLALAYGAFYSFVSHYAINNKTSLEMLFAVLIFFFGMSHIFSDGLLLTLLPSFYNMLYVVSLILSIMIFPHYKKKNFKKKVEPIADKKAIAEEYPPYKKKHNPIYQPPKVKSPHNIESPTTCPPRGKPEKQVQYKVDKQNKDKDEHNQINHSTLDDHDFLKKLFADYHNEINLLNKISMNLPINFKNEIDDICQYTQLIMNSMENDPRDVTSGQKFLTRYLEITLKIVKNVEIFFQHGSSHPAHEKAAEQGLNTLIKLKSAFIEQHHRLLENDLQDLESDSNFVDTLLKMEGFK